MKFAKADSKLMEPNKRVKPKANENNQNEKIGKITILLH